MNSQDVSGEPAEGSSSSATAPPKSEESSPTARLLPPYKVLLHNDDVNDQEHVIMSLLKVTPLSLGEAERKMLEAHQSGVSMLLTTHRERAELYQEQLHSYSLVVTIEPDA